jgi:hypothetical protein
MGRLQLVPLATLIAAGLLVTAQAGARSEKKPEGAGKKTTICHRTGSVTNPYVKIKVSNRAVANGHGRHAGDIIPAPAAGCPTTPLSPTAGGTARATTLTGAAESPGPGDPNGTGSATIRLQAGEGRVCFQLSVANVALPATGAHIHSGAAGIAGPIVVALTPPNAGGTASGCVTADRALVSAILANPAGYYVNVHTSEFPAGAVRGQL